MKDKDNYSIIFNFQYLEELNTMNDKQCDFTENST